MHILIIEDNPDIIANLYGFLEPLNYTLNVAYTGRAGIECAKENYHDAIILDLTLPNLDGLDVCRELRTKYKLATPILMLTARDTLQDKLIGFEAGADDYLVKPFSLPELDARLKALVRRSRNESVECAHIHDELRLDTSTTEVFRAGKRLALTPIEYKILNALVRNAPSLLTREALEREVWGDTPPDSDSLRTHIHALRQVVDKPFAYPLILTVPGYGYRLADSNAG